MTRKGKRKRAESPGQLSQCNKRPRIQDERKRAGPPDKIVSNNKQSQTQNKQKRAESLGQVVQHNKQPQTQDKQKRAGPPDKIVSNNKKSQTQNKRKRAESLSQVAQHNKQPRAQGERKRAGSPDEIFQHKKQPQPANKVRFFSHELGHDFTGFIPTGKQASSDVVARCIYDLPIPAQVTHRLILFVDGSIKFYCGAVGVIWRVTWEKSGLLDKKSFGGRGAFFPVNTDDSSVLEMFGIATALRFAIKEIKKPHAKARPLCGKDNVHIARQKELTRSHDHNMRKELFIFTDEKSSLSRLNGEILYRRDGYMAEQIANVCALSHKLAAKGVHVELHYSPGHCGIPGNEAAHDMSRVWQTKFNKQTTISWPVQMPGEVSPWAQNPKLKPEPEPQHPLPPPPPVFFRPSQSGSPGLPPGPLRYLPSLGLFTSMDLPLPPKSKRNL